LLPLGEVGDRGIELVRTQVGDLGLAMDGDDGLFVYPLAETGELGDPIVIEPPRGRPSACPAEASGFIVNREMQVAPYLEAKASGAPLAVTRLRARYIVGYDPPCLEGIFGVGRTQGNVPAAAPMKDSVPLSILNTDSNGNRLRLTCE
jgi:hypothetical protein